MKMQFDMRIEFNLDSTFNGNALPLTLSAVHKVSEDVVFFDWLGLSPKHVRSPVDAVVYLTSYKFFGRAGFAKIQKAILCWYLSDSNLLLADVLPNEDLTSFDEKLSNFLLKKEWLQEIQQYTSPRLVGRHN